MKPASLLRWYPRAWRERYGEELLALIQDTAEEERPAWRLRIGLIWGGLRERGHQARRAGAAAVQRWATPGGLWSLFGTGLVLASLPEVLAGPAPRAWGWQTEAADGLLAAVALAGAVVLASGLVAVPAVVRFWRADGWPKIRRRVLWATAATGVAGAAGGILAWVIVASGARSWDELNSSWALWAGLLAAAAAISVAIRLWAAAVIATAGQLTLTPRVRAIQLMLGAVRLTMVTVMFVSLTLWWSAVQPSLLLLVLSLVNLASGSVFVPARFGRAIRTSRRLRAAASGATVVNPSAQRTHGRHRA